MKNSRNKNFLSKSVLVLICLALFISCVFFSIKITALTNIKSKEDSTTTEMSSSEIQGITVSNTEGDTTASLTHPNFDLNFTIKEFDIDFCENTKRALISLSQNEFKNLSNKEFSSLCKFLSFNKEYKYLTVELENGKGLLFNSAESSVIPYGILTSNGLLNQIIGYVILDANGNFIYKELDIQETAVNQTETTELSSITTSQNETTLELTNETKAQTVFVTAKGKKFHRSSCSYLTDTAREIQRSNALNQGYTPCSRCKP